ncbi:MAG: hypothetical protein ACTSP4_01490 [Candidatus Hodarchaeales archaeon]
MSTVKFTENEKLKRIQARLFLLTDQKLSQQEILELAINIVDENINLLAERISKGMKRYTNDEIAKIRQKFTHWGKETRDISSTVDETLYQ